MNVSDARSAHWMGLDVRDCSQSDGLEAERFCGGIEIGTADATDKKSAAREGTVSGLEWFFSRIDGGILQAIAKRGERGFRMIADSEHCAFTLYSAGGRQFGDSLHGNG